MRKKMVALLVVTVCFVAMLAACSGKQAGIVGYFKLTSMGSEAEDAEIASLEQLGMVTYLEFKRDKTVVFENYGKEFTGTYTEAEISLNDETIPYTLEDGTLMFTGEKAWVFQKISQSELENIKKTPVDLGTKGTE